MLSKPSWGWTEVQLGEFSDRASYLTDIPMECLDAFIWAFKNNSYASVHFDAEGWDYYLIAKYERSYITSDKEYNKTEIYGRTLIDIARELIEDIERDLIDWVNWEPRELSNIGFEWRRNMLVDKISILKKEMEKLGGE